MSAGRACSRLAFPFEPARSAMESEDVRRYLSIKRCDELIREQDFPGAAVKVAAKRVAILHTELTALWAREEKTRGVRPWDGKEIRKRSRDLRKEHLTPIAKAAKGIRGFITHTPGAAEALKLPHVTDSAEKHVEVGERFGGFMKDHRKSFLEETAFDRNFLSKLRAAVKELKTQSRFATASRTLRTELLRDIKEHLQEGRAKVDLLGSLLEPLLIERKLVGAWAQASRVGRKIGRPRDTPEQRTAKQIEKLKKKQEKLEEQRKRREALKAARQAKKALEADVRKQKKALRNPPPAAPPPVEQAPVEPPLTKAVFLERLAEEGGEVER